MNTFAKCVTCLGAKANHFQNPLYMWSLKTEWTTTFQHLLSTWWIKTLQHTEFKCMEPDSQQTQNYSKHCTEVHAITWNSLKSDKWCKMSDTIRSLHFKRCASSCPVIFLWFWGLFFILVVTFMYHASIHTCSDPAWKFYAHWPTCMFTLPQMPALQSIRLSSLYGGK
jgi:hypothetical protein